MLWRPLTVRQWQRKCASTIIVKLVSLHWHSTSELVWFSQEVSLTSASSRSAASVGSGLPPAVRSSCKPLTTSIVYRANLNTCSISVILWIAGWVFSLAWNIVLFALHDLLLDCCSFYMLLLPDRRGTAIAIIWLQKWCVGLWENTGHVCMHGHRITYRPCSMKSIRVGVHFEVLQEPENPWTCGGTMT